MGHGAARCTKPKKEEGGDGFDTANGGRGYDNGGMDAAPAGEESWATGGGAADESSWGAAPAATTAVGW